MGRAASRLARPDAALGGRAGSCWGRRARERPPPEHGAGGGIHFVGVGGAGMSGYARAASALGAQRQRVRRRPQRIPGPARAGGPRPPSWATTPGTFPRGPTSSSIYSSAVGAENVERRIARERAAPRAPARRAARRAQRAASRTIAVAGTHGKTTTSSMIVHALRAAGLDPELAGGRLGGRRAGELPHGGEGQWLVVEADESDRSMLSLKVQVAVLTNVELDHHATYFVAARAARGVRRVRSRARRRP